jgi:hypothetical protein
VEEFNSEIWGLKDNIFIRGSRRTVSLLALWSLLAAIGGSLVARNALMMFAFRGTFKVWSSILCSFWSGAVGREFTAAMLTWHKARRSKKQQEKGKMRGFGRNTQDKRRNLDVEVPDVEENAIFYEDHELATFRTATLCTPCGVGDCVLMLLCIQQTMAGLEG